jgi:hypothetical protein
MGAGEVESAAEGFMRSFIAIATPVADAERHVEFMGGTHTEPQLQHHNSGPVQFKMTSEKKVADNMLWGGRFTGMFC